MIALLPLLALGVASLPPSRFEASVGLGAGYDSNVELAPSGSAAASFGSATLSAWADGGWSFAISRAVRLYAGARYDGLLVPDAPDLNRHVPGADLALTWYLSDDVALLIAPGLGYAFYGDDARSSVRVSARALARYRPLDWLSLRAGYGRSQSWASDAVFSVGVHRLFTSVEARVARRSYVAAGYAFATGGQVFYREVTTTLLPSRNPHRGSGQFASLEPYQADANEHTLTLRWEQGLWRELYLTVSYDHTRGSSIEGRYAVNSGTVAVGYRF